MQARKTWVFAMLAPIVSGCPGGPGEAEDPSAVLEDEYARAGEAGGAGDAPPEVAASREDCRAAAAHLESLGVDLAIREEKDPEKQKQLRESKAALVSSDAAKRRIEDSTSECLARETRKSEALCIARAQDESAIERCAE